MEDLIRYVLLADLVQGSKHLQLAIQKALELALPLFMLGDLTQACSTWKQKPPNKGAISRARLVLDCCML
eukprot:13322384-Alexandrium_andersonii.AAC.1